MTKAFDNKDEILIKYLLGELPEKEAEDFEDEILLDPELSEREQIVKMILIDNYVRGEMTAGEMSRFEQGFLIIPENRERVEDARLFHDELDLLRKEGRQGQKEVWGWVLPAWLGSPAIASALAVLLVALSAALLYLYIRSPSPPMNPPQDKVQSPRQPGESDAGKDSPPSNENKGDGELANSDKRTDEPTGVEANPAPSAGADRRPRELAWLSAPKRGHRIDERIDDSNPDSRGSSNNTPVIPVKGDGRLVRMELVLNEKDEKAYLAKGCCEIEVIHWKRQKEDVVLPRQTKKVDKVVRKGEVEYIVTIDIPSGRLKDEELYYIRNYSTIKLNTYFKVDKKTAEVDRKIAKD